MVALINIDIYISIFNLAKRGYCNAGICVCLCVCMSTALYHTITALNMDRLLHNLISM